ncbi:response regulator [Candidatus Margulisiibacteriota bacterium]
MSKPTVLIIEDFVNIRKTIEFVLENDYDVIEADSAEKGMQMVKMYKPDLVILDHQIPGGLTGMEVVRLLRKQHNHVPVIMMSGFDIEKKARQSGAEEFLQKPFNIFDIQDVIRRNLAVQPA